MRPRALVTGAGQRVGRAVCLELARSGFDVAVHYRRSREPAEEVVRLCREAGAESFSVPGDLANPGEVHGVAETVRVQWDRLELLVNNASIFEPCAFEEISLQEWDRMQAVNLRGPFLLSQALVPLLRAAAGRVLESALVVHMCDIGAVNPVRGYAHYSVSKAGLVMLVKAMAVELAPAVRAVGISPGHVEWPEDYGEAKRAALTRRIPMQRVGTPQDVARLIRFLALEAPYVNGAIVPVDGGLAVRY